MATPSSILAWRIPWTEDWWTIVHGATESDMTELLIHTHQLASGPSHLILEGSVQVAQELECHSKPSEMPSYNNIQKSQIFVE